MKKKLTGIIAAVAALALGASLLAGCGGSGSNSGASGSDGATRTVEDIQADGKIVIGVFSDKNPFGYVDENGEYQGYDIELARQIGTDLGVEVEFVSTEAANRVEYLKTNKVDLILANFTVTEERAEAVDFCEAYMNVALGAVSHKSHVITSLDDVKDEQVIVISGTTAETYLTANYPNIKQQKFDTYAAAKTAFENDKNALWLNDNTEVIAFANADLDEYVVGIETLGNPDTIAPAVAKGNESLLTWINDEMVKLGSQNFFHAAYEKTLLDTYGADYEDTLVVEPGQA
ncbi:MAG: transporter substrate-binding domain-containing protein [Coriobacteriales bacterium]